MRINIKCMLACRRARQLLHREQCGEQIAPHLQMWLKEHLEQCRACQRERMLWLAIREALSEVVNQALGTMDAHDERRLLNGIHLRLIRDALVQSHQRRAIASLRWALHGCALGLALLVGFAVGWALHPPKQIVRTIYVPTVRERVVKVPVTVVKERIVRVPVVKERVRIIRAPTYPQKSAQEQSTEQFAPSNVTIVQSPSTSSIPDEPLEMREPPLALAVAVATAPLDDETTMRVVDVWWGRLGGGMSITQQRIDNNTMPVFERAEVKVQ